ncbi:cell wall-binding repeat-containing protein [Bacillus salacetis]|uniref:cell wall-binding repeat-containing protein n=1 Tax=Bacillus salacetis TaxID=2315464 RepID=UPI003BA3D47A
MKKSHKKRFKQVTNTALAGLVVAGAVLPGSLLPGKAKASTTGDNVVISEVYGGGGNSGAEYKNDFIELYNPTNAAISLDGWSVQYASKSGTSWSPTSLAGTIPAKGYYLIQQAAGNGGTLDLPTPDATGNTSMSASSAKVALASNKDAITDKNDSDIVDFVGYGDANEYEGSGATPSLSAEKSAQRNDVNVDTDNNSTDFSAISPVTPKNSRDTDGGTTPPPADGEVKEVTIDQIRANDAEGTPSLIGSHVKFTATVTAAFGSKEYYVQDATGGVNLYDGVIAEGTYSIGDTIEVTGEVIFYNGLTEISPSAITKTGTAEVPAPKDATIAGLNDYATAEALEGSLVTIVGKASDVQSGTGDLNVTLQDENGKLVTARVKSATKINVASTFIQGKTYQLTGVVGQYDSSSPYESGYQVMPRSADDVVEVQPFTLTHQAITDVYSGNDVTFTAMAEGAETVTLYYRATGSENYSAIVMESQEENIYSATLSASEVPAAGFDYYIESVKGEETKHVGSAAEPMTVTVSEDTEGPAVSRETPMNLSMVENKQPAITAAIEDPSGVDESSITVTVDGTDVTGQATFAGGIVSYTPATELAVGQHTVVVTVQDTKGNSSEHTWTFEVVKAFAGGNHYRGSTHNHTNISHDGSGTPEEALIAAKKYQYDWFAFSDHSHDIDPELIDKDTVDNNGMPERTGGKEWQDTKALAEQYTNDEFAVFPAFEMTSTTWGHSNVFGTDNFIDRKQNGGKYQNLNEYYAWILQYDDIAAQFNHPGWPEGAFNGFMPYDAGVDQLFTMIEVGNGSGHYSYDNQEDIFFNALDLGWHVAPTYGEDNHDATWGETNVRTVIVSNDLSEPSLLNSMRNLRLYMSEDPNATLDFKANGLYMGATVEGETLNFEISGNDLVAEDRSMPEYDYLEADYKSDDTVTKVELLTNGQEVVDTLTPNTKEFTWTPTAKVSGQQWFVVRVTQADGERIYSAPIWSQEVPYDVKISGIGVVGETIISGTPVKLEAGITNLGTEQIDSLDVKFYYDDVTEANYIGTKTITGLAPKTVQTAAVEWSSPVGGEHKIIAVFDAPGTDVAADNRYEKTVVVKEPLGITVLVDASHNNDNTSTDPGKYANNLGTFKTDLRNEGYEVIENTEALTPELLSTVDVLVMTQPNGKDLTADENAAVSAFVQNGGSAFFTGKSNHNNKDIEINNDLLKQMGSEIQISNDGIFDVSEHGNFWSNPSQSPFAVRLYPDPVNNYITDKVSFVDYYSGASLYKVGNEPLTNSDTVTVLAHGNETTYQNYVSGGYTYDKVSDETGGSAIPAIASETIGDGKIVVSGMNIFNDKQLDEGYEPKGNDEMALNSINWLADREVTVENIGDARDLPNGTSVVVEGTVTSDTATFFDAFYIEDETGGIFAYKEIPDENALKLGDKVRVYGKIKMFEGDLELEFGSFEQDVIKIGEGEPVAPAEMTTSEAALEENQGELVKVTGKVVSKYDEKSYVINDGSGDILVFTDGYIVEKTGAVPALEVGETLEAIGITSTFSDGKRIRVRDTRELSKVITKETISISEARGKTGETVTIEGTVTGANAWGKKSFYMQDSTGGTFVFQNEFDVQIGDHIVLTGTAAEYNAEFQVSNLTFIEKTGVDTVPAALEVTPAGVNEETEGQLVSVKEATIKEIGTPDQYKSFTFSIEKGEETVDVRVDNRSGLSSDNFGFAVGDKVNVTGIASDYNGTYQVKVRQVEDVAAVEATPEPEPEPEVEQVSISEARAKELGAEVKIEGVVTSTPGVWGSKAFYVQDNSGGTYVYQGSNSDVKLGDHVTVTGITAEYNGEFQLSNISAIEILGDGTLPEYQVLTPAEINEDAEGELVMIQGATISELTQTNDYGTFEFTATKDGQSIVVRVDNRSGLKFADFAFANGDKVDVRGIVGEFNGTYQLKPRGADDFASAGDSPEKEIATRVNGENRYETSALISKKGWTEGADTVVLVRGDAFPDALVGTPLAKRFDAPILLTKSAAIDPATMAEIERLGASKVIILGGKSAVSAAAATTLADKGITVERIAGDNRYATAAKVGKQLFAPKKAFVVDGKNFPDALAIASYAAENGYPIFLTENNKLPEETLNALQGIPQVIVVGGTAAVSNDVFTKLPNKFKTRISGANRYETAANFVEYFNIEPAKLVVATGEEFADALSGSAYAAKTGSTMVLTRKDKLPAETAAIMENAAIQSTEILGGENAISAAVKAQIEELVK